MATANTVSRMHAKPAVLGDTATIGTTFTLFKTSADSAVPVKVYIPGTDRLRGKSFRVHASGNVKTAVTTNVTVTLQYGTSGTPGSNTTVEASTAVAVNTTDAPWSITGEFIVEDVLKTLRGSGTSQVAGTHAVFTTLDNAPTSVDPTDEGNAFVVGITFSVGDAGNKATLEDFHLEVM